MSGVELNITAILAMTVGSGTKMATALAAILTRLPLALAIGQRSGIEQPLAIAFVAGLLRHDKLVLPAMPMLIGLTLPRARAPDQ